MLQLALYLNLGNKTSSLNAVVATEESKINHNSAFLIKDHYFTAGLSPRRWQKEEREL